MPQAGEIYVNIGAKTDQLRAGVSKAAGALNGLGRTVASLKSMFVGVFAVTSIFRFFGAIKRGYDEQSNAETQLLIALKGRQEVQTRLIAQASELQKITLFGDEETIRAQALIAAFTKEESSIRAIIPLVQDLAAAKKMDLATASDLVSKTLGSSTNALARYGIQVEGEVGSTKRLTMLIEGLSNAFKGQAQAAALAGAGGLKQLGNVLGDIGEKIGGVIIPILNRAARGLISILSPTKEYNRELDLTNIELNNSLEVLKKSNLSNEARKILIEEINTKYKEYLPYLLTEKSTLEDIEKVQKGVNDQLRAKILTTAMEKEITDILQKEFNTRKALYTAEIQTEKALENAKTATSFAEQQRWLHIASTGKRMQAALKENEAAYTQEAETVKKEFEEIAKKYDILIGNIKTKPIVINVVTGKTIPSKPGEPVQMEKEQTKWQILKIKKEQENEDINLFEGGMDFSELDKYFNEYDKRLNKTAESTKEQLAKMQQAYTNAQTQIEGFFYSMMTLNQQGVKSMGDFVKYMLSYIQRLVAGYAAQAIAIAFVNSMKQSKNPYLGIAMGVSSGAMVKSQFNKIEIPAASMANEGSVTGPTHILAGDYPGASTNPEHFIKDSTLKNLKNNSLQRLRIDFGDIRIGNRAIYIAAKRGEKEAGYYI